MQLKQATLYTVTAIGVASLAYLVWFDYRRRNDPKFRKRLKLDRRRAAKLKKAQEESARIRVDAFVKRALEEVSADQLPTEVDDREKYFMEQVAKGEQFFGQDEASQEQAAICFYRALKVFPDPVELLNVYQKTVPETVFMLVYSVMKAEMKRKQEEYWETFPPKHMNVKVVSVNPKSNDNGEKFFRGLFATRDFAPGDVIFEEDPIVSALETNLEGGDYCSYCMRRISNIGVPDDNDLFSPVYCSQECLREARQVYASLIFSDRNDETELTQFVDLIKSTRAKYPLMIARFFARMVFEETQKMASGIEEEYTMIDHVDRTRYLALGDSADREFELTKILLASSVPGIQEFITKERYLQLLGRLMYNSYAVKTHRSSDPELPGPSSPVENSRNASDEVSTGAAYYLVASHIRHSCVPNVQVTFPYGTKKMAVVAKEPIHADDEIKVSYILNDMPGREREEALLYWRFRCSCRLCLQEDSPPSEYDDEQNSIGDDSSSLNEVSV